MAKVLCKKFATATVCGGNCEGIHCFLPDGFMLVSTADYNKMNEDLISMKIKLASLETEARIMSRRSTPPPFDEIQSQDSPNLMAKSDLTWPKVPAPVTDQKANVALDALKKFGVSEFGSANSTMYPLPGEANASDEGKQSPNHSPNMDLPRLSYKYKTEKCKYFEQGRCNKGDACTYIHDSKFNGVSRRM